MAADTFAIPRIDVTEIHEHPQCPEALRDGVTDELQMILNTGKIYQPIAARLAHAINAIGTRRIVDLCSGAGGPWLWLRDFLQLQVPFPLEICFTDKFPNIAAFARTHTTSHGAIHYCAESVDATTIPEQLEGFRTVFSSFHHFGPNDSAAILQNAVNARQGIAIFEAAQRSPFGLLRTFLMPIGGLLTAPFIRPFRASRLFWTYLIPSIPFVLWFDGVLSCLRAYSIAELTNMVAGLNANDYTWEIGEERGWLAPVTYLIGYPT